MADGNFFAVLFCLLFCGVFSFWGRQPVSLDDQRLSEITNAAIEQINTHGDAEKWRRLVEIKSATKQAMNGVNWQITFTSKPTDCLVTEVQGGLDAGNCIFQRRAQEEECTAIVFEPPAYCTDPLQNQLKIHSQCANQQQQQRHVNPKMKQASSYDMSVRRHRRSMMGFGAPQPICDNDEILPVAVKHAMMEVNVKTNSMYIRNVDHVESATRQIVEGTLYNLSLIVRDSGCRKYGDDKSEWMGLLESADCQVNSAAQEERCKVTVSLQMWQNTYTVRTCVCQPIGSFRRRKRKVNSQVFRMEQPRIFGMFEEFKAKHDKVYSSIKEETKRFNIFQQNMIKARKMEEMDLGSARYGASKFADLTEEEFRKFYLTPTWKADPTLKRAEIPKGAAPTSFDWRDHNAVSEVKNQGTCGSCWAFSTTGNIEGQWALKKGKLLSLSEQELVDCDKVDQGCNGGLPSQAYKEIMRLGGLEGEKDYPYHGRNEKCSFKKQDVEVYINGSVAISKNETQIATWLAANGPISIGINANAMQFYLGGISHPWSIFCNPNNLDHGVLIVGYGMKGSEPYWIIKNSWGPTWGEKGYYLVYRGAGVCGLNQMCTSAVVN